jgi:hypothetical protein
MRETYALGLRQYATWWHQRRHRGPGHRTLSPHPDHHTQGRHPTIRLAPRTARVIDLAIGEGANAPSSWPPTGGGWTGTVPPGDRGRASLGRHATYIVAAFVAGAAR